MVAHNNEALKKVLLDTKVKAVIPLARHIVKLESLKDFANSLDDYISEISNMADKNKDLVAAIRHYSAEGAEYLVQTVTAEQLATEKVFRECLVDAFADSEEKQRKVFGKVYIEADSVNAGNVVRNLKGRICDTPGDESDEDILEKILFSINLDKWIRDNFPDEEQ